MLLDPFVTDKSIAPQASSARVPLPPWHGTSLSVGRSAPRLRRQFMAATSLCDDLGTGWPSHAAFDSRRPCFCRCCTCRLEQPAGRRTGIHNAAAVPTSAEVWTFPAFSGPKTLHVTLFSVTWRSYATLRHVNWTSFIIIIIIIIIITAACKLHVKLG